MKFLLKILSRLVSRQPAMTLLKGEPLRRYSEAELRAFEALMGIRLPQAYRDYLMLVGAGTCATSKIDLLEEWNQPAQDLPADFLKTPFPHISAWNDRSLLSPQLGWRSPYYDSTIASGSLRITNTGCEGYHLLVVSGPEYGNIWHDDRACNVGGIYPLHSLSGDRLTVGEYLEGDFEC